MHDQEDTLFDGHTLGDTHAGSPNTVSITELIQQHELGQLQDASVGAADDLRELLGLDAGGRYDVAGVIRKGGMGSILSVRDRHCRRQVAMKMMLPRDVIPKAQLLRFISEAQVTSQLEHPNIVPVYELDVDETGALFYTMKLIQGETLTSVLEELEHGDASTAAEFSLSHLVSVFQRVCDAVAFAHSRGVIHRDLKPDNVMLGEFGEVLVVDWGIAKVVGQTHDTRPTPEENVDSVRHDKEGDGLHTLDGSNMGTPAYMAPEQGMGRPDEVDERSDIYSLGCILFQILTLRAPFHGKTFEKLMNKKRTGQLPPFQQFDGRLPHCSGGSVPPGLAAVCSKALAPDPAERYQTVKALQDDLSAWQDGFATEAEGAGFLQQARLLFKRHRGIACALLVMFLAILLGLVASTYSLQLKNREEARRIAQGVASAPQFVALARKLLLSSDLTDAATAIQVARDLDPANPELFLEQGRLQMIRGEFADAKSSFHAAMSSLPPGERRDRARAYWTLSEPLAALPVANLDARAIAVITATAKGLEQQQDPLLASHLLDSAGLSARALSQRMEAARRGLEESNPGVTVPADRLHNEGGWVFVSLDDLAISDISVLQGLPISSLSLAKTRVHDLSPLRGMPLTTLKLEATPVIDFSVLRELPLTWLQLWELPIDDLSVLSGKPMTWLSLYGTKVEDVEPLRDMPLEWLSLGNTGVDDIRPLSGMPLRYLNLKGTRVQDLHALEAMPLESLFLQDTPISDLEPLAGMPLQTLNISRTRVHDLSPLEGLPLRDLRASSLNLRGLGPIPTLPLRTLYLNGVHPPFSVTELLGLHRLETLTLPGLTRDLERARELPALNYLDFEFGDPPRTVERFFQDYDAHHWGIARLERTRQALEEANGVSIPPTRIQVAHSKRGLNLADLPVHDLSPLRGSNLNTLSLVGTGVRSIQALEGLGLTELRLEQCPELPESELEVLLSLQALQRLTLPPHWSTLDRLKSLPHLAYLSTEFDYWTTTAEAFWRQRSQPPGD